MNPETKGARLLLLAFLIGAAVGSGITYFVASSLRSAPKAETKTLTERLPAMAPRPAAPVAVAVQEPVAPIVAAKADAAVAPTSEGRTAIGACSELPASPAKIMLVAGPPSAKRTKRHVKRRVHPPATPTVFVMNWAAI